MRPPRRRHDGASARSIAGRRSTRRVHRLDRWGFTALRSEWNELLRAARPTRRSSRGSGCTPGGRISAGRRSFGIARGPRRRRARSRSRRSALITTGSRMLSRLELLGTGDAGSDYLDVIVRRGYEAEALRAIEQFRHDRRTRRCVSTHLAPIGRRRQSRRRLAADGWTRIDDARRHLSRTFRSPATRGIRTWRRSASSHRANVRRRLRALEQTVRGALRARDDRGAAARGARRARAAITSAGSSERGRPRSDPALRAFHDEVTQAGARPRLAADVRAAPERHTRGRDVRLPLQRPRSTSTSTASTTVSAAQRRPGVDGALDSRRHRRRRRRVRHALRHRALQVPLGARDARAPQHPALPAARRRAHSSAPSPSDGVGALARLRAPGHHAGDRHVS